VTGLALVCVLGAASPAAAASATSTLAATITIQASCQVASSGTLDFGTATSLAAATDVQTSFAVLCTSATAFNIGLDGGAAPGGTVATRLMTSASGTVGYKLYSNAAYSTNWGSTVGSDTVPGTGSGGPAVLTVYGRVPPQATPAPGTYSDTVTVTVTY